MNNEHSERCLDTPILAAVLKMYLNYPVTILVVIVGLVAAVTSLASGSTVDDLGWHQGDSVEAPWRLITAHFVHLNAAHFAVNFTAAVLFGLICDRLELSLQLLVASLIVMVCVSLGLEFGPWEIDWYVGFSGVLHGIFAWLCLRSVLRPLAQGHWWGLRGVYVALFLGGLVKVLVSLKIPVGSVGWQEIPQVTPAHLYGFAGGSFWALLRWPK